MFAPIALLLVATLPWLVPWPWESSGSGSVAEPAPSSSAAEPVPASPEQDSSPSAGPTRTAEQPDDDAVKKLGKKVSDQQESYDLPVDKTDVEEVSTTSGPYKGLGRIAIRKLGLDVPLGDGVFAPTLTKGPGHWPGTPLPGRVGNSVVAGHRDISTRPFAQIDELQRGNTIVVTLKGQLPTTFVVDSSTIVPEAAYRELVLREPRKGGARQLTLLACHPEGSPANRIVVRATAKNG